MATVIKALEKYLYENFGIKTELEIIPKPLLNKLPVYLRSAFEYYKGNLFEKELLFAVKTNRNENTVGQYQKQSIVIEEAIKLPIVFALDKIESYNRKRFIEKKIAFVVPGKQLYIPMLFLDFNEYKLIQKEQNAIVFPAAQCLFIFGMLNKDVDDMNFQQLAGRLGYTKMTITRAVNNLCELNLCRIEGNRNKKILFLRSKETWLKALPYLINPLEKVIAIEHDVESRNVFISGNKALAHYTNLNDAIPINYAVSKARYNFFANNKTIKAHEGKESDYYLQIWKYDPALLTKSNYVDPLSLYLTTKDDNDERVESEYKKLIERLW